MEENNITENEAAQTAVEVTSEAAETATEVEIVEEVAAKETAAS